MEIGKKNENQTTIGTARWGKLSKSTDKGSDKQNKNKQMKKCQCKFKGFLAS